MQKPIYELKENPLSIAIYGEVEDVSDLAENMKQVGQITPITIKPDGIIISGHRRYRAARQAGIILVNVEVKTPRDKDEEEFWIISANKQREKTADQLYREGKRLEAIFSKMAKANISAGVSRANQKRAETPSLPKLDKLESGDTPTAATDIMNIYDEAMARSESAKESQMQNSAIEKSAVTREEPKPNPVRTRNEVAKALKLSPTTYQRIKTVGDAAEAGVPEAQEAMRQLARKEITVNKANTMVLQALHPELAVEKPKPDRVDKICDAFTSVNPIVRGVIDDIESETPEINVLDAKHIVDAAMKHIKLINIMKEKLFIYIEDKEVEQRHAEG